MDKWSNGEGLSNVFIQTFMDSSNRVNVRLLNKLLETNYTTSQVKEFIKDTKFSVIEMSNKAKELVQNVYKYGKFDEVRLYIPHFYEVYGIEVDRVWFLGWVATQHPKKVIGSFLPSFQGISLHE